MGRAALRVVEIDEAQQMLGRWQEDDSILFHRRQIRVGARLQYWGRIDHGKFFEVVGIRSQRPTGPIGILVPVQQARRLDDVVVLRRLGSTDRRQMAMGYLSYSAVWRLA